METRQIWASQEINEYVDFPHVGQVFSIRREVSAKKTGRTTIEIVHGITSLPAREASPQRLLELNRGHWGIENKLHWVRDVTFDEDRSQIRTGNAPRVMASLRNLVISLLRMLSVNNIAQALRTLAGKPYLALRLIRL